MKNIIEFNPVDPLWVMDYNYIIQRAIEENAYIITWKRSHIFALRVQVNRLKKGRKGKISKLLMDYEPFTLTLKNGKHAAFIGKKDIKDPFADLLQLYAPKINWIKDYLNQLDKEKFIIVKSKANGNRIMQAYRKMKGFTGRGGYFEVKEFKDGRYIYKVTK